MGDVASHVAPELIAAREAPSWPPDAFAVAASLLRAADAYTSVLETTSPSRDPAFATSCRDDAKAWRMAVRTGVRPPRRIRDAWASILRSADVPISGVRASPRLVGALLRLCSTADEASAGFGLPPSDPLRSVLDDAVQFAQRNLLGTRRTLCHRVDASRVVVFPKMHTPQVGITARSLTHNLALLPASDVEPRWKWIPRGHQPASDRLNLLLLPWPLHVNPSRFSPVLGGRRSVEGREFGLFRCDLADRRAPLAAVRRIVARAQERVGELFAIVFPEGSLRPDAARRISSGTGLPVFAGVGEAAKDATRLGWNAAGVCFPDGLADGLQHKHHRWRVEERQIRNYGLGASLSPTTTWWEAIDIPRRQIFFWSLNAWLTVSVLVCEDLARQDPIADTIRAVGPNLVVALLADGPQLEGRWSARYATVLADDPGSSVLTLTSAGMARLSRPPGAAASSVVGLWKDPDSGAIPLELPRDDAGLVLCLNNVPVTEWSADGRSDGGVTASLRLNGVHAIPGG